jgi:hypothetical protein
MEEKAEQSIDRIKLLENHLNEMKSIISCFFEKKGRQFRDIKIFRKSKDNKSTDTIDDLDIHSNPVIIDFVSITEFREKMDNLDAKLNGILDLTCAMNTRMIQPEYIDELREMINIIRAEIKQLKSEQGTNVQRIDTIEKTINQIENGGVLCFE